MQLDYNKIEKTKNEIIIFLDSSKLELAKEIGVNLTRNIDLHINKEEEIYINKTTYDVKENVFVVETIYTFKDKKKIKEHINNMFENHNIKKGKEVLVNSYDTLIAYLKNNKDEL
jgi:hypothetical protein